MKESWQRRTISELCEVVNGGTPKTGIATYWGGDHAWITPAEMGKRDTPYVETTQRTLTDQGLADSSARLVPPYSVILSSRAPIGHLVINTVPMATNQGCKSLVPTTAIDHKFLYYFLLANVDLLNALGTGTTFIELSGGNLKEVALPLPPLPEQKRIVAILDEAFAGIDAAIARTEQSAQQSEAVLRAYLDSDAAFDSASARQHRLTDLCVAGRVITYGVIKLGDHIPEGVPCLRTSNVRWLDIETDRIKCITETLSQEYKRTILQGGELLVNVRGTLGGVAVAQPDMQGWNVSREVAVVPIDPAKADPHFLAYWIARGTSQAWLTGVLKGAAYTGINIEDLRELPVSLPSREKQAAAVQRLDCLRDLTRRLEETYREKRARLDALKQSILAKAFAGDLTTAPSRLLDPAPA